MPHLIDRVLGQQLKHADVLPHARARTVTLLQAFTKVREYGRQLPAAIDVRVVQGRRTTAQRGQIVQRVKHLVARLVASRMAGDQAIAMHDVHPIRVALHRDRLEGVSPRHAVADVVESGQLILVDLGRLCHARIEDMTRQRLGLFAISRKQFADRVLRSVAVTLALRLATFQ